MYSPGWRVGIKPSSFLDLAQFCRGLVVLWRGDWSCDLANIPTSLEAHGRCEGQPSLEGPIHLADPAENGVWGGLLGLNALGRAQGRCRSVPGDGDGGRLLPPALPPWLCCAAMLTLVPSVLLGHQEQACKTTLIPLSGTSALLFEA